MQELKPTALVTLIGTGFFPGSVVRLNGTTLTTRYADSGHLDAVVPLGQIRIASATTITVFNPAPGGGTSNSLAFTIVPLPKVYLPMISR